MKYSIPITIEHWLAGLYIALYVQLITLHTVSKKYQDNESTDYDEPLIHVEF